MPRIQPTYGSDSFATDYSAWGSRAEKFALSPITPSVENNLANFVFDRAEIFAQNTVNFYKAETMSFLDSDSGLGENRRTTWFVMLADRDKLEEIRKDRFRTLEEI